MAKTELEELGEEQDEYTQSTSKLRGKIKQMTGFDIMADAAGTQFKDIYDIVVGIGEQWGKLTDTARADILETLGGKRGVNSLAAVMNNISRVKDIYKATQNAEGSAEREEKAYERSVQYRIDQAKARIQELTMNFMGSDILKGMLDGANAFLDVVNKIVAALGTWKTAMAGLAGVSLFRGTVLGKETLFGDLFSDIAALGARRSLIKNQAPELLSAFKTGGVTAASSFLKDNASNAVNAATLLQNVDFGQGVDKVGILKQAFTDLDNEVVKAGVSILETGENVTGLAKTGAKIDNLGKKFSNFGSAIGGFVKTAFSQPFLPLTIATGLTTALVVWKKISDYQKQQQIEAARETSNTWDDSKQNLDEYIAKYQELYKQLSNPLLSESEQLEIKKQLLELQQQINGEYGSSSSAINLVNGDLKEQLAILRSITQEEAKRGLMSGGKGFSEIGKTLRNPDRIKIADGLMGDKSRDILEKVLKNTGGATLEDEFDFGSGSQISYIKFNPDVNKEQAAEYISKWMDMLGKEAETYSGDNNKALSGVLTKIGQDILLPVYQGFQSAVDENKDEWNNGLEMLVANVDSKGLAGKLKDATSDLNDALIGGDTDAISSALDNYISTYNSFEEVIDTAVNSQINKTSGLNASLKDLVSYREELVSTLDKGALNQFYMQEAMEGRYSAKNPYATRAKEIKEYAKTVKESGLDIADAGSVFERFNAPMINIAEFTEAEQALYNLATEFGYVYDQLDSKSNLSNIFSAMVDSGTLHSAAAELKKIQDEFNETKSTLESAINVFTGDDKDQSAFSAIISEAKSASGLTAKTLSDFRTVFGKDAEKAIERTTTGLRLNERELAKLQLQYNEKTKSAYMDGIEKQGNRLSEVLKQIDEIKSNPIDYKGFQTLDQLKAEQQQIEENISALKDLAAQYSGVTSSYMQWQNAQGAGNDRDMYQNAFGAYEDYKKQLMAGWTDNGLREWLHMMTGMKNYTTATYEDLVKEFQGMSKSLSGTKYSLMDFYDKENDQVTKDGITHFVKALNESFGNEFAKIDGSDLSFDLTGNKLNTVLETWGIGEEIIEMIALAARSAGYNVAIGEEEVGVGPSQYKADTARKTLQHSTNADLKFSELDLSKITDASISAEERDKEIQKGQQLLNDYFEGKGGKRTLEGDNAAGILRKWLQDQEKELHPENKDIEARNREAAERQRFEAAQKRAAEEAAEKQKAAEEEAARQAAELQQQQIDNMTDNTTALSDNTSALQALAEAFGHTPDSDEEYNGVELDDTPGESSTAEHEVNKGKNKTVFWNPDESPFDKDRIQFEKNKTKFKPLGDKPEIKNGVDVANVLNEFGEEIGEAAGEEITKSQEGSNSTDTGQPAKPVGEQHTPHMIIDEHGEADLNPQPWENPTETEINADNATVNIKEEEPSETSDQTHKEYKSTPVPMVVDEHGEADTNPQPWQNPSETEINADTATVNIDNQSESDNNASKQSQTPAEDSPQKEEPKTPESSTSETKKTSETKEEVKNLSSVNDELEKMKVVLRETNGLTDITDADLTTAAQGALDQYGTAENFLINGKGLEPRSWSDRLKELFGVDGGVEVDVTANTEEAEGAISELEEPTQTEVEVSADTSEAEAAEAEVSQPVNKPVNFVQGSSNIDTPDATPQVQEVVTHVSYADVNTMPLEQDANVNMHVVDDEVQAYQPEEKEGEAVYKPNYGPVNASQPPSKQSMVTFYGNFNGLELPEHIKHQKIIIDREIRTTQTTIPGGKTVNGTAHANGTANAHGNWGVKRDEDTLINELGEEIIIRDGRWFTVNNGYPTFTRLKKDDIVFNHRQSEALFKKGYVTGSHGKLVGGSAHAAGVGNDIEKVGEQIAIAIADGVDRYLGDVSGSGSSSRWDGSGSWNGGNSDSDNKGSGNGGGGGDDGGDTPKKKKDTGGGNSDNSSSADNLIDWIETLLKRINDAIENLKKQAENYVNYAKKIDNYNQAIAKTNDLIKKNEDAEKKYKAQAKKAGEGLSPGMIKNIENGTMNIEEVKDEKLRKKIQDYQNWYEKAIACRDAIDDLNQQVAELAQMKLDAITSYFDAIAGKIDATSDRFEAQSDYFEKVNGYANEDDLQESIKQQEVMIKRLQSEYDKYLAEYNKQIASGEIKKGSEADYAAQQHLEEIKTKIEETKGTIYDTGKKIEEIPTQMADKIEDKYAPATNMYEAYANNAEARNSYQETKRGWGDASAIKEAIDALKKQLDNQVSERNAYERQYNALKEAGKLTKEQDMAMRQKLQEMSTGITNTRSTIAEKGDEIAKVSTDRLAKTSSPYDTYGSLLDTRGGYWESYNKYYNSTNGKDSTKAMQNIADNQSERLENLERQLDEYEKTFNDEVAAGNLKPNTEEYTNAVAQMTNYRKSIMDLKNEIIDTNSKIRETNWSAWNNGLKVLQNLQSQIQSISGLLGEFNTFDSKTAKITQYGKAQMNIYAADMASARKEVAEYEAALKRLNEEFANGEITKAQYDELFNDTYSKELSAAQKVQSARKNIIDTVKRGIEAETQAMNELISKRKEALQRQKEADDYARNMRDKNKSINQIKQQIAALSGDTTEATQAKIRQLQAELAEQEQDLEDARRDHEYDVISRGLDDEMEKFRETQDEKAEALTSNLSYQDKIIKDALDTTINDYKSTFETIQKLADEYGITIPEALTKNFQTKSAAKTTEKNALKPQTSNTQFGDVKPAKTTTNKNNTTYNKDDPRPNPLTKQKQKKPTGGAKPGAGGTVLGPTDTRPNPGNITKTNNNEYATKQGAAKQTLYTARNNVPLRKKASKNGGVVINIPKAGTAVVATGKKSGNYLEVTYKKKTGWAYGPYLLTKSAASVAKKDTKQLGPSTDPTKTTSTKVAAADSGTKTKLGPKDNRPQQTTAKKVTQTSTANMTKLGSSAFRIAEDMNKAEIALIRQQIVDAKAIAAKAKSNPTVTITTTYGSLLTVNGNVDKNALPELNKILDMAVEKTKKELKESMLKSGYLKR